MSGAGGGETVAEAPFAFALAGGGRVVFSARAQGNLSTQTGAGHERGRAARERLCEQLGLQWLCASRQVHGTAVQLVTELAGSGGEAVAIDADGHATAQSGIGAMVLSADCLPVALGCEGAVAMVHAGWRGLAAGVLEAGVGSLHELGGSGPIDAVIGPGAGVCCYEVGPEVHAALGGEEAVARDSPPSTTAPPRNVDLRATARRRLLAAGAERVREVEVCTICDERFFSHRREGERAGRQGGIAWLS